MLLRVFALLASFRPLRAFRSERNKTQFFCLSALPFGSCLEPSFYNEIDSPKSKGSFFIPKCGHASLFKKCNILMCRHCTGVMTAFCEIHSWILWTYPASVIYYHVNIEVNGWHWPLHFSCSCRWPLHFPTGGSFHHPHYKQYDS